MSMFCFRYFFFLYFWKGIW
uniref:Uncharacterized protein n=1 Tax=Anguilla anguilla TaxID=7936 RepID=A0A0E9P8A1_ANGAN